MSGFEWFLLVVVVIAVPLVVAVAVTLWTLEQARQRNRKNRDAGDAGIGPVKRQASRSSTDSGMSMVASSDDHRSSRPRSDNDTAGDRGPADSISVPDSDNASQDGSGGGSTTD